MTHITRLRQQDLGALVSLQADRLETALIEPWKATGRPREDLHLASLLALATTAVAMRKAGDLPVEVWAECMRIAADPSSLLYQLPALPGQL